MNRPSDRPPPRGMQTCGDLAPRPVSIEHYQPHCLPTRGRGWSNKRTSIISIDKKTKRFRTRTFCDDPWHRQVCHLIEVGEALVRAGLEGAVAVQELRKGMIEGLKEARQRGVGRNQSGRSNLQHTAPRKTTVCCMKLPRS